MTLKVTPRVQTGTLGNEHLLATFVTINSPRTFSYSFKKHWGTGPAASPTALLVVTGAS